MRRRFSGPGLFLILVILCTCQSYDYEQSYSIIDAHEQFVSFLNKNPEYNPFSYRVDYQSIKDNSYILPVSYNLTPDGRPSFQSRGIGLHPDGPRIFYRDGLLFYTFDMQDKGFSTDIICIEVNIDEGTYRYIAFSRKEYTEIRDNPDLSVEYIFYERDFPDYSESEYSWGGAEEFSGSNELICTDPGFYFYEKDSVMPYTLEAFIIIPRGNDGLTKIFHDQYYYENGFSFITGLDSEGFYPSGYDLEGYAINGYNKSGYDRMNNKYTGPFHANQKNGFGTLTWANGDSYRGFFQNDRINGYGVLYGTDGSWYAGSFINGAKSGRGLLSIRQELPVLEEWTDGIPKTISRGQTIIVEPLGEWAFLGTGSQNGLANGKGDAIAIDSGWIISDGLFDDGKLIEGTLRTTNGAVYKGDFKEGMLVNGQILSPNGTVYKGEISNGTAHGQGFLINVDNTRYEGFFVNGKYHGEGKLSLANGDVLEGPFDNGLPHGTGVYINASENTVESCEFYQGKRIDQVYLLRIENAKQEARKLAEEERLRLAEEEQKRQEEARRIAAEKAKKDAEDRQLEKGLLAFGMGFVGSKIMGLDTGQSLQMAAAITQDVLENTDGTHIREAGENMVAQQRQIDEWERKYGIADLSYTDTYVPPSQPEGPEEIQPVQVNTSSSDEIIPANSRILIAAPEIANAVPTGSSNNDAEEKTGKRTDTVLSKIQNAIVPSMYKMGERTVEESKIMLTVNVTGANISSHHIGLQTITTLNPKDWDFSETKFCFKSLTPGYTYNVKVDTEISILDNCEFSWGENRSHYVQDFYSSNGIVIKQLDKDEMYSFDIRLIVEVRY